MLTHTGIENTGKTDRRTFILAGAGALATLATLHPSAAFGLREPIVPGIGNWPWPAPGLDPVATAGGSLAGLNGCATMTFGLILNALREIMPGSIWQSVGRRQVRRAFDEAAAPGADCGGILGPLYMMTLVGAPASLQQEFYAWYCGFAFPTTDWDDLYPIRNTVRTVSQSPLCQQSRTVWESAFSREVLPLTGVYDTTRCSKVPRDCAKKAIELINAFKAGGHAGATGGRPPEAS